MASEEEYRQVACGTLAEDSGADAEKWSILHVALQLIAARTLSIS